LDEERVPHAQARRATGFGRGADLVSDDVMPIDLGHDLRHSAGTILVLISELRRMIDADQDARIERGLDGIAECARMIATMSGAPSTGSARVDLIAEQVAARERLVYTGEIAVHSTPALAAAPEVDLVRVIVNLTENACKAAGHDGHVELEVSSDESMVTVTISDSGPGFTDRAARTGLGLSIVTGIVVRLAGEISFTRSALGGAEATVRIPRFPPSSRPTTKGKARRKDEQR
jgi:two-component system sensor histidine kinase QseC